MAMKGPKERAQTEVTMLPRAIRRSGLKLLQLIEPSAQKQQHNVTRRRTFVSIVFCSVNCEPDTNLEAEYQRLVHESTRLVSVSETFQVVTEGLTWLRAASCLF